MRKKSPWTSEKEHEYGTFGCPRVMARSRSEGLCAEPAPPHRGWFHHFNLAGMSV